MSSEGYLPFSISKLYHQQRLQSVRTRNCQSRNYWVFEGFSTINNFAFFNTVSKSLFSSGGATSALLHTVSPCSFISTWVFLLILLLSVPVTIMPLTWCLLPHTGHPLHTLRAPYSSPIPVTWYLLVSSKVQAQNCGTCFSKCIKIITLPPY